ncbi:MAG: hypothetical protein LBR55_05625 [Bacteroidales bacterium]|jgi:hypothetical protein|nr:hypothetical protein [Bacteroidales bacterium]
MKQKSILFTPTLNSTFFVVASTLDEFGFCAALNETLGITLRIAPSVNESTEHNLYTGNNELSHVQVDVLVNKALRSVCVDFLENIDYIIRVNNISTESEVYNFQEQLLRIGQCVFVQKLDLSKFTAKQAKQLVHLFV